MFIYVANYAMDVRVYVYSDSVSKYFVKLQFIKLW